MNKQKQKIAKRAIRQRRVRSRVFGTLERPRLSVFKANRHIYGQIIDDVSGKTILSVSSLKNKVKGKKVEVAGEIGKQIAAACAIKKINQVVFDRGGYKYHGRVKALAEGAREGGLVF